MRKNLFYVNNISYLNRISFNVIFITEHFLGKSFLKKGIVKWKSRNIKKINTELSKFDGPTVLEIDVFENTIAPQVFRENYINKGIPVLIRGGAKNWKAVKEWDFEFFKKNYGDQSVILTNSKELGDEVDKETEITTLSEIIDGLDKDSTKYARFNPLLDQYPELTESFDLEWIHETIQKKVRNHHVFLGKKGTKTNIHNAGDENIFVQIRGKKKWLIWDHQATYGIAPTVNRAPAKGSDTNPYSGNETSFGFTKMPRYELELEAGDIIYIPSYLWHYVENSESSIGVGIRWISHKNAIKNLPLLAILELFNTSPSIFKIMKLTNQKSDFNKLLEIIKEEKLKTERKENKRTL